MDKSIPKDESKIEGVGSRFFMDPGIELSCFFTSLGPLSFLLVIILNGWNNEISWDQFLPSLGTGLSISLGGFLFGKWRAIGVIFVSAGFVGFFVLIASSVMLSPSLVFFLLGTVLFLIFLLQPMGGKYQSSGNLRFHLCSKMKAVRLSCYITIGEWILVNGVGLEGRLVLHLSVFVAFLLTFYFLWSWVTQERRNIKRTRIWIVVSMLPLLLAPVVSQEKWVFALGWLTIVPLVIWLLVAHTQREEDSTQAGLLASVLNHPERTIVLFFTVLGVGGGLLIYLFQGFSTNGGISVVDSLFTAVSAVCVTGLTVVSIENTLTGVGQFMLMVLIQLGGLGIMAVSSVAALIMGRRLSLHHEYTLTQLVGRKYRGEITSEIKEVIKLTFYIESIGAFLLTLLFMVEGEKLGTAIWRAVFTAISAFCNAGFALQDQNLVPYQTNPFILNIVGILIILGGLSPAVIVSMFYLRRHWKVPLQNKVVLLATLFLLLSGTCIISVSEWSHALARFSTFDKIDNAWFSAITPRTAGFNSVDFGQMRPATLVFIIFLMFIGGSPGGTTGGIKTTAFVTILFSVLSVFFGRKEVILGGRKIPESTVNRAWTISATALMVGFIGLIAILLTQEIDALSAVFEVFSALGTVGLSMGATSRLDSVGKIIIMLIMLIGRVGPLTLFIFMTGIQRRPRWKVPQEDLVLG